MTESCDPLGQRTETWNGRRLSWWSPPWRSRPGCFGCFFVGLNGTRRSSRHSETEEKRTKLSYRSLSPPAPAPRPTECFRDGGQPPGVSGPTTAWQRWDGGSGTFQFPEHDTSARRARIYPRYMSDDENTANLATADLFQAEIARLAAVNDRLRAEIERLRSQPCPYVTGDVTRYCTLTPFTLTDAERAAVKDAIGWIESPSVEDEAMPEDYLPITATLRGLLERVR